MPKLSVHSHPKKIAKKIVNGNTKTYDHVSIGIPLLPTSTTKVGEGLGLALTIRQSTTRHINVGTTRLGTMGVFLVRPLATSQS